MKIKKKDYIFKEINGDWKQRKTQKISSNILGKLKNNLIGGVENE